MGLLNNANPKSGKGLFTALYGTIICLMDATDSKVMPAPPSLMRSLMAGFDAVSNHIGLILFSMVLDLVLWLGPHLQMSRLIQSLFDGAAALPGLDTPEMADLMRTSREVWLQLAQRFNLLSALRSYPVGIPSLMVSRSPLAVPGGIPFTWQLPSFGIAVGLWILLTLIGLVAGTLYFSVIAQAAISGNVNWRQALRQWPWASLQVLLLAFFWLAVMIGVSIPFSCVLSTSLLFGIGIGQFAILIFGAVIAWIFLPLVFSPHGIFAYHKKMWDSLREGVRVVRMTLPSTGLFILSVLILSEGLDLLWRIPAENSWFSFVGLTGHAFITSGLLAASFVYYRDARRWVDTRLQRLRLSSKD